MRGDTLIGRKKMTNECIRWKLEVASIVDEMRLNQLRWIKKRMCNEG